IKRRLRLHFILLKHCPDGFQRRLIRPLGHALAHRRCGAQRQTALTKFLSGIPLQASDSPRPLPWSIGARPVRVARWEQLEMSATIALVDDDRNILTSLSIALQAEGFVTRLYSDGQSALKALIENPPDLAVCDIKMPRMDGIELLRRLRECSALPV